MAADWIFCYLWPLAILVGYTDGHSLFSCEPIILRMCQDLPYNTTFMPNLLNHYDQQTAALAMEIMVPPLIKLISLMTYSAVDRAQSIEPRAPMRSLECIS